VSKNFTGRGHGAVVWNAFERYYPVLDARTVTMPDRLETLILDMVEWIAASPRPYPEVLDAWQTSCPRLSVWEDAVGRGYVTQKMVPGMGAMVSISPSGKMFLRDHGRKDSNAPSF
jgi:hypothetical protein